MADLGSQNNSITVNVASGGNKTNVNTTYDSSIYYSNIAKEWAISNQIVSGEDYSSKYYANKSKQQADIATGKATEVVNTSEEALEDINTAKTGALSAISEQEEESVDNINTAASAQIALATQQAQIATQQAQIATNKANEATTTVDNAISSITEQETTSKNNVTATGTTQIGLIQQEAQEQISNIEQLGFYMRDSKLYYVDENGQEQEFESGSGADTVPLFTGMYFDFKPNNVSWLKAGEQKNSGGIYTFCYNTLVNCLTEANNIYDLKVIETSDMIAGIDYSEYWKVNQDEMWFKTPTKISYMPINADTAPVIGNGIAVGLTNGSVLAGMEYQIPGTYAGLNAHFASYGKPVSSSGGSTVDGERFPSNSIIGVTTDPENSGLIADLSSAKSTTAQLYFKVANAVENLELLDAGEVLEALADKQDKCTHITETYQNGTSGYRIWSDGWCEQWGVTNASGQYGYTTVTFLKKFANTNYNIQLTARIYEYQGYATTSNSDEHKNTQTTLTLYWNLAASNNIDIIWSVSGHLAEEQS